MTALPNAALVPSSAPVLRGMPSRTTNLMEMFQMGIVEAIAAAAGCNIFEPRIDNGIDFKLVHELPNEEEVSLHVQLKAVTGGWNTSRSAISATMSRQRYDRLRRPNPSLHSIVLIMDLPSGQSDWIRAHHPYVLAKHCTYWVNLAGNAAFTGYGDRVAVSAPATNVFDDAVLCQIMARIRAGGAP